MEEEGKRARGTSQWILLEEERKFSWDLPLRTESPMAQCENGDEKSQIPLGKCTFAQANLPRSVISHPKDELPYRTYEILSTC